MHGNIILEAHCEMDLAIYPEKRFGRSMGRYLFCGRFLENDPYA